jgi:hypothetical protein
MASYLNPEDNKLNTLPKLSNKYWFGKIKLEFMDAIQNESPHALAVSVGAVAGRLLRNYSPVAVPEWGAAVIGAGLGCVGFQFSQGADFGSMVVRKATIAGAAGAALSTMYPLLGSDLLNTAAFTFVGDQLGAYFLESQ